MSTGIRPVVWLEWFEVRQAALVGTERRVRAFARGLTDCNLKTDSDRWDDHINGACAELAVAKYLDMFWSGSIDTIGEGGDVGPYQVRSSRRQPCWAIRPRDKSGVIFLMVFGRVQSRTNGKDKDFLLDICGWIGVDEAKRRCPKHSRGNVGPPAWWVTIEDLHPMSTFWKDQPR